MTEEVFVPRWAVDASDKLALETLEAYQHLCLKYSLPEVAGSLQFAIDLFRNWQTEHPELVSAPGPLEVDDGTGETSSVEEFVAAKLEDDVSTDLTYEEFVAAQDDRDPEITAQADDEFLDELAESTETVESEDEAPADEPE